MGNESNRWAFIYGVSGIFENGTFGPLLVTPFGGSWLNGSLAFDAFTSLTTDPNATATFGGIVNMDGPVDIDGVSTTIATRPTIDSVGGSPVATLADLNDNRPVDQRLVSGSIMPDADYVYAIGGATGKGNLRYSAMSAASGIFNELNPQESGTWIQVGGSLAPDGDGTDFDDKGYSLGLTTKLWSTAHIQSGIFGANITSPAATITSITAGTVTSTTAINALGTIGAAGLAIFNGGTFFGNDMAPSIDKSVNVGLTSNRFITMHLVSGFIDSITPNASGSFTQMFGHFHPSVPSTYQLGLPTQRWAAINAVSGVFTNATANTANLQSLTTQGLTVETAIDLDDAVTITQQADVEWDMNGGNYTFVNGGTVDMTDGTTLDATNINSTNRPTVTNASGVAMQEENYFEVYGGRNVSFANPATTLSLYTSSNGAVLTPHDYYFTVSEDVQIRNFTCQTTHLGSSPAPWALRLRVDDAGVDHASGMVTFSPTANVAYDHFGTLSGTQTIPAGSRCRFIFDADGGSGHNTVFAKVWLGLTVVSGLQRGPQED